MSLRPSYFDRLYRSSADPWSFLTRHYETRKRELTLAALAKPRYRSIFEPGCAIGVLTAELAKRAERVVASDPSERALRLAAGRVPSGVELHRGSLPDDWPVDAELTVLSEVGYYLDHDDCRRMADRAMTTAEEVVAVHWRHPVVDYPLGGDDVHAHLTAAAEAAGLTHLVHHVEPDLRLDSWRRSTRSVAGDEGLDVAPT